MGKPSKRNHSALQDSLAAIVVWYEPTEDYLNNIKTYVFDVGHTWVIDNSVDDHSELLSSMGSVTYISLGRNYGIAHALNIGCQAACDANYEYILTMDQDSAFYMTQLETHLEYGFKVFKDRQVAIVAVGVEETLEGHLLELKNCSSAITSGNLLRLAAWSAVGGFDKKLFIDQVDHEFCYRLRKNNYIILKNTAVSMNHQVGEPITGVFLGRHIRSTNHAWVRRYYHFRNSLYLRQQYPEYSKPFYLFLRDLGDQCIGIILLEDKIGQKFLGMIFGAWDFLRGRYGAWEDNHPDKTSKETINS